MKTRSVCVEALGSDVLRFVGQRAHNAPDLRIGDKEIDAIGPVLLPHGVERHLHQGKIAGTVGDIAPDRVDHRVLFGNIRMTGQAQRVAHRFDDTLIRDSPQPQHGFVTVPRQMLEQL